MFVKAVLAVCLLGMTLADKPAPRNGYGYQPPQPAPQPSYSAPRPSYSAPQPSYDESREEGMPFEFSYGVQDQYSGNDFAHSSESDGKVTSGEYRVLLPDGRTQIVKYYADHENGYQAEVSYEGEARPYEAPKKQYEQPKPAYSAPQPTYEQPQRTYGANF